VNINFVKSPRRLLFAAVLAAAALGLGACGEKPAPQPVTAPAPAAHFSHITLVRAGGIAGVRDTVQINQDGSWTATDKAGKQKSGTIPGDQLDQLVTAAADRKLSTEAGRPQTPTKCNDAFSYVVTVDALSVAYADCPADSDQPTAAKKVVSVIAASGAM
jgi:hypothetical protein